MWKLFLFLLPLLSLEAATIAIVDTGLDLDHEFLRPKLWRQENEAETITPDNLPLLDHSHLKNPVVQNETEIKDLLRYRELRAKGHQQGLNPEEFRWFQEKNADKKFMNQVHAFKRHTHGTIVAGIAAQGGENIKILPIRAVKIPLPFPPAPADKKGEDLFYWEVDQSIKRVTGKFQAICQFALQEGAHIVNASYGITHKSISLRFRDRFKELTQKELDEIKLNELLNTYFQALYEKSSHIIMKYPQMLFVFSAGNSGLSNDEFHHYPSRIKAPNAISVTALNGDFLASFSNYGKLSVDIGAPGVAILSILPTAYNKSGNDSQTLSSGTSMAAPMVSNLAAQMMNINPLLKPAEIKEIILLTAQKKDHLKDKIFSSSMVDPVHALRAANLSKETILPTAIALANSDVVTIQDKISLPTSPVITPEQLNEHFEHVLPIEDKNE